MILPWGLKIVGKLFFKQEKARPFLENLYTEINFSCFHNKERFIIIFCQWFQLQFLLYCLFFRFPFSASKNTCKSFPNTSSESDLQRYRTNAHSDRSHSKERTSPSLGPDTSRHKVRGKRGSFSVQFNLLSWFAIYGASLLLKNNCTKLVFRFFLFFSF